MASKTARRDKGKLRGTKPSASSAQEERIALTVKVGGELYVRLNTFRAKARKTSQEVLEQALVEYLDRAGA